MPIYETKAKNVTPGMNIRMYGYSWEVLKNETGTVQNQEGTILTCNPVGVSFQGYENAAFGMEHEKSVVVSDNAPITPARMRF